MTTPRAAVALPDTAQKRASGENFPVALRVLPTRLRDALLALYDYARYVDDLGDEYRAPEHGLPDAETRSARRRALTEVADQVRYLYADRATTIPAAAGLSVLRAEYHVPVQPFLDLVQANLIDQEVSRYPLLADLLDYCALSANPVGRVVLHLLGDHRPQLTRLSDLVCTGLQIIEHVQDVGEDCRAGRIYLPLEDLERFGVDESDLARATAAPPVRRLIRFETERALAYLEEGAALVGLLHGWGRLAVIGFVAGGRAAAGRIEAVGYDVLGHDTTPGRARTVTAAVGQLVRRPRNGNRSGAARGGVR